MSRIENIALVFAIKVPIVKTAPNMFDRVKFLASYYTNKTSFDVDGRWFWSC